MISTTINTGPFHPIDHKHLMSNTFQCTQCGLCCVGLNIPLSVNEALLWIARGNRVKILVEAIPWLTDQVLLSDSLKRKETITFTGISGTLAIRLQVTLVAYFSQACPHLNEHNRCGIYDERPMTCRVYPFELNPNRLLNPNNKLCPKEAWSLTDTSAQSIHQKNIQFSIIDSQTQSNINTIHQRNVNEVSIKQQLCVALGIRSCSLSNDGYLFHQVNQTQLLAHLQSLTTGSCSGDSLKDPHDQSWLIHSNSNATLQNLVDIGSHCEATHALSSGQEYIHFQ